MIVKVTRKGPPKGPFGYERIISSSSVKTTKIRIPGLRKRKLRYKTCVDCKFRNPLHDQHYCKKYECEVLSGQICNSFEEQGL